jgi:alcohol dehydrogenase
MEAAAKAISAIKRLSQDVGIPSGLRELGVKEEDFSTLADNTLKDVCIATNPRKSSKNQIIQLFRDSM